MYGEAGARYYFPDLQESASDLEIQLIAGKWGGNLNSEGGTNTLICFQTQTLVGSFVLPPPLSLPYPPLPSC